MANKDMKIYSHIIYNQKNANSHPRHFTVRRLTISKKVNNIKCQREYMCKQEEVFGGTEMLYNWTGGDGCKKITCGM